ncbi:MAG: hypothetical protein JNK48_24460 [Bryobacterales bacterium]|nr:hypothetical protein [Bryobacterales bacterium]
MKDPVPGGHRILITDDNEAIHEDLRKILTPAHGLDEEIAGDEEILFGTRTLQARPFRLDSAFQGRDALRLVQDALRQGDPYSMAFVDVRMPPGWDGVETIRHLWREDPDLQVVLCTAYTDYSWREILENLGDSHHFVILKKPFETIEVTQLAHALTSKREALQESRRHLRELEEEIRHRRDTERDLVAALDAAEEANRCKRDFLATMSHEFRTPLNAILGYTDMMAEDARQLELPQLLPTIGKVQLAGRHLLELVSDILDMSRIESGRMAIQKEKVSVAKLVQEAVALAAPLAAKRGNRLLAPSHGAPLWIEADEARFRQCLLNLLGNACKFTAEGEVSLEIAPLADSGRQWIEWTVRDSGIGIAPEHLPKLFRPFSQIDSAITRKYGGTGLGLAITQRLCHLMGGDIRVESTPGAGSAFTIRIPAAAAALPVSQEREQHHVQP